MQITMLETRVGTEDLGTIKRFHKGESYDCADTLARTFIRSGWAVESKYADDSLFDSVVGIAKKHDNGLRPFLQNPRSYPEGL